MNKKLITALILIIILAIVAFGAYYVNDYYHADESVNEYLNGTDNVTVKKIENGLFLDGPSKDTALIFYPGAKVEYTSYMPLLMKLSNDGVDCFLVEMPFNIAFFGEDSASKILDDYDYNHTYISGHSLGGVVASQYLNKTDKIDGLILLDSYPTKHIKKPVLSIYGSEDNVLNYEKYNESKPLMDNLTEIIIDGGNHAQVGNYGIQDGDGAAKISSQKQQGLTAKAMDDFIEKTNTYIF